LKGLNFDLSLYSSESKVKENAIEKGLISKGNEERLIISFIEDITVREWENVIVMNIQPNLVNLFSKTSSPSESTFEFRFDLESLYDSELQNILEKGPFERFQETYSYKEAQEHWIAKIQQRKGFSIDIPENLKNICDFEFGIKIQSECVQTTEDDIFEKKLKQSFSSIQTYLDKFEFVDYLFVFGEFHDHNLNDFKKCFPSLDVITMKNFSNQNISNLESLMKGKTLMNFSKSIILKLSFLSWNHST
jgi:hypothetical protein